MGITVEIQLFGNRSAKAGNVYLRKYQGILLFYCWQIYMHLLILVTPPRSMYEQRSLCVTSYYLQTRLLWSNLHSMNIVVLFLVPKNSEPPMDIHVA